MKCTMCGAPMIQITTDLPFKVRLDSITIIKGVPVFQCSRCREYLIEDPVMEKLETILEKAEEAIELEIIKYAA